MSNDVYVSCAGSGKTTYIVNSTLSKKDEKHLIITFTINNHNEIKNKFYELNGSIPSNVIILTWYKFLLTHLIRPYQNYVYDQRINSMILVSGESTRCVRMDDIPKYYLNKDNAIYSDKMSLFATVVNTASGNKTIDRLEAICDNLYIDEVQDLAGYDLELLKLFFDSNIRTMIVGDIRQSTYRTNFSRKNKKYAGEKIIDFFKELEQKEKCLIHYRNDSFRCNQTICDFADKLYPEFPDSTSNNSVQTNHDGIFYIPSDKVDEYISKYNPQVLRYNKTTKCPGVNRLILNWGDSKGLTFDRVLIYPNGPLKNFLKNGKLADIKASRAKLYVAITRARHSTAFVCDWAHPDLLKEF